MAAGDGNIQSIEQRVESLIESVFDNSITSSAFFTVSVKQPNKTIQEKCVDLVKDFWASLSNDTKETRDLALRVLVQHLHNQWNPRRVDAICAALVGLVENSKVEAKSVCDALLSCDKLSVDEELHWVATFSLARKIIGGVDYKGARDLLKVVLEKCQLLNSIDNVSSLPRIEVVISLVKYIINRNSCLMPAYLAIYEISKSDKNLLWPHWPLGKLLCDFVDGFRHCAQMVSISGRHQLLPIIGHSMSASNVWRLNQTTLRFALNGPLPFNRELQQPQTNLLRYVLEQSYSRELVCNMLELNIQIPSINCQAKQLCEVLEQQLVDLLVLALERFEHDTTGQGDSQLQWQHLSSQLIYFVLFQFASFSHIVLSLYEKLKGKNLKKGRHHLMWVLLQFISGSIQKNPIGDFLPVMKLYDLLYDDNEPIPLPDINNPQSTHVMAATCIWIHLNKKAGDIKLRPIPISLREHLEFLKQNVKIINLQGYKIALLCNAYSTDTENFNRPMGYLVETIYGNQKNTTLLPGNVVANAPTVPLQMNFLDSLTVHAKMSLIHSIVSRVIKLAKNKSPYALAPSLVETYSRLLVYMEIESLGIKGFIYQLLPTVVENQALGILHTLLEMFSYRLHHTQINYRIQLLAILHKMSHLQPINQNQLHMCVESTILKLIIGLGSSEVQPQLSRISSEAKGEAPFLVSDSEELNRALVLTIARAMHVTGLVDNMSSVWCEDILNIIMQKTPLSWPSTTLQCFPHSLAEYFRANPVNNKDNKMQLRTSVENEYKKWRTMCSSGNENETIATFSMQGNAPLFLCIIWKNIQDEKRVPPTAFKVLDRLGPRALTSHLRTFADYLVYEIASSPALQNSSCIEALTDMVWKYNIITIDKLVLCLALRCLEGKEAQVQFVVIQFLLTTSLDFSPRIKDFVPENTSEHWAQSNWHDIHMAFHKKYPEKFYYDGSQDMNNPNQYLPVYFGNVCLRFIPVLDLTIQRFLEMGVMQKALEVILDHIGGLYKFHDHPITYLYNTLFYYEKRLADKANLKRKLVGAIIGAFRDIRPDNWCLSDDYLRNQEDANWVPEPQYYIRLITRLRSTIAGEMPPPYPSADWRFNEFPNASAHALHSICVELMALPVSAQTVGEALLDVSLKPSSSLPAQKDMMSWYNSLGLILTALPESYWTVLNDRIMQSIQHPVLASPSGHHSPFKILDVSLSHLQHAEMECSTVLELCHGVWHHAGIGQLSHLPQFVKDQLKPVIKHENQFIYLCHLVGPFLQRFHMERTRCLLELTVELYEILLNVDMASDNLHHMDAICDFLYHIKYMFVGDGVRSDVEKLICKLRPALKLRLRFISHLNLEETKSDSSDRSSVTTPTVTTTPVS